MNTAEEINHMADFLEEVDKFRKANEKCISTTHTIKLQPFQSQLPALLKKYPKFTAEFNGSNEVEITIPRWEH